MTNPENRMAAAHDSDGRFVKGVSGNPGGRPKGLASYIRDITGNGMMLADKVLCLLNHPKGRAHQRQRMQMECIQWLADRGFGKAVQNVEHAGQIEHTWDMLADLSLEDVKALALAYRALQEQKAQAIEGEVIEGESHPVDVLESDVDASDEAR